MSGRPQRNSKKRVDDDFLTEADAEFAAIPDSAPPAAVVAAGMYTAGTPGVPGEPVKRGRGRPKGSGTKKLGSQYFAAPTPQSAAVLAASLASQPTFSTGTDGIVYLNGPNIPILAPTSVAPTELAGEPPAALSNMAAGSAGRQYAYDLGFALPALLGEAMGSLDGQAPTKAKLKQLHKTNAGIAEDAAIRLGQSIRAINRLQALLNEAQTARTNALGALQAAQGTGQGLTAERIRALVYPTPPPPAAVPSGADAAGGAGAGGSSSSSSSSSSGGNTMEPGSDVLALAGLGAGGATGGAGATAGGLIAPLMSAGGTPELTAAMAQQLAAAAASAGFSFPHAHHDVAVTAEAAASAAAAAAAAEAAAAAAAAGMGTSMGLLGQHAALGAAGGEEGDDDGREPGAKRARYH